MEVVYHSRGDDQSLVHERITEQRATTSITNAFFYSMLYSRYSTTTAAEGKRGCQHDLSRDAFVPLMYILSKDLRPLCVSPHLAVPAAWLHRLACHTALAGGALQRVA
jgi:hypothetical protein